MKKTFILSLAVVCSLFFLQQISSYQTNAQETTKETNKQPSIIRKSEGAIRRTALTKAVPEYPIDAKEQKVEGDVVIEITISENGDVINAKAISGEQVFIQPTLEAVKKWTFDPQKLNDKPAKVTGTLSFRFKLDSPFTSLKETKTDETQAPIVVRRSESVIRGIAVNKVPPVYPAEAKEQKIEGDVVIEITINEEGKVSSAKTISGHELLSKSAEEAAKNWTFNPTSINGQLTKVSGVITFRFLLKDDKE
ncbi:MAG: energy transducer TonB [Acidobacteria bacterium]|nr:energy transducer TonB [Acidobacteriota bacterium]